MNANTKIALSVLAIAGIATVTYSFYKRYKLQKIYDTPVSPEQALDNIRKALAES
jgi:hypothetical protein